MMSRYRYFLIGLILLLPSLGLSEEIGRADTALNDTISTFITTLMTDEDSDFYQFVLSMMIGFAFIGTAWHCIMWAIKEITNAEAFIYILLCILAFTFYLNYNSALSELWSWSDAIGLGVQEAAIGTRDPIFIGSNISDAMNRFFVSDISLWDGFNAISVFIVYKIIAYVLSVVIFIASMWGVWGYAFSKITGIIFLPLVFLPATRGFVDKWFQIFLGFWFFNLFSKIALTLYHLYFFAIFGAVADPVEYSPIADRLVMMKMALHFVIGIFFVISVAGLSAVMASGSSGITASASSNAKRLVVATTKFFTKI